MEINKQYQQIAFLPNKQPSRVGEYKPLLKT